MVTQQDLMAQAQGQIAQGLVEVYRAMGGGWEIRCQGPGAGALPAVPPNPYETQQELPTAPASPPVRPKMIAPPSVPEPVVEPAPSLPQR